METNIKNNIHLASLYTHLFEENKKLELDKKIIIEIPKNESYTDYLDENAKKQESKFHQADYDSFTTGCSYLFFKNILGDKFMKGMENKLNCYHGLYSCYDLNTPEKEDKYLNNASDAYIILFNEKLYENIEIKKKIDEEIINSKLINCKLNSKELGRACIIFINSENKNEYLKICGKYMDYINIKNFLEYKEGLKNIKIVNK